MKICTNFRLLAASAALMSVSTAAVAAGELYGRVSGSASIRDTSINLGQFSGDFVTGQGTIVPAGRTYTDGTDIGWATDFKTGWGVSGAIGHDYGNSFRTELEFTFRRNSVKTHEAVVVDDPALGRLIVLDGEDAGLLTTGSGNIGTSVGAVLGAADGNGRTMALMANGYWDVPFGGDIRPYLGAGIGLARSNYRFAPSGLDVAKNGDTSLAYQAMAGVGIALNKKTELFAGYKYFETDRTQIDINLIPVRLGVENKVHSLDFGIRFKFGS